MANGYAIEDRKLDPSIERIFRGSSEQRSDVSSKRDVDSTCETSKAVQHEDADKRVRMKRDSPRSLKNEKRSVSGEAGKSSSRISRHSKDLPKLPDKDYGGSVDQEKSEFTDEAEDDSASRNKETRYLRTRVEHG